MYESHENVYEYVQIHTHTRKQRKTQTIFAIGIWDLHLKTVECLVICENWLK